ncbi:MAG: hypothetical protein IJC74_02800 [Clostridia bacterium]|nr:hypothetical protein [Clostridia bacterium]
MLTNNLLTFTLSLSGFLNRDISSEVSFIMFLAWTASMIYLFHTRKKLIPLLLIIVTLCAFLYLQNVNFSINTVIRVLFG